MKEKKYTLNFVVGNIKLNELLGVTWKKKVKKMKENSYALKREVAALHVIDKNISAYLHAIFNIIYHQMI